MRQIPDTGGRKKYATRNKEGTHIQERRERGREKMMVNKIRSDLAYKDDGREFLETGFRLRKVRMARHSTARLSSH